MSRPVTTGSADQSIRFWAYDSDGAAVTGEAYNSAGMAVSVVVRSAGRVVSTTALTLVARSGAGVHTDSALTEVGGGEYVVDLPDSYSATDERDISLTVASTAITGAVLVETIEIGKGAPASTALSSAVWTSTLAAALAPIRSGTAQAGDSTTITLDASASSVTNFYVPCGIYLTGGTGAGQFRTIDDYNGTTKVATVSEPWYTTPDNTTTFAIRPEGVFHADIRQLGGNELSAGYLKAIADYYGLNTKIPGHVESIATDAITAASLATDAVTEIQSGLATAAELLLVKDRVSYCLTVLVGACADAGTAAETYVHAIGGETFTVDYTGLDDTGTRTTTTLSKV